ncbi:CHAT domain-containing protein [Nocardia salmonicida]|uniref:CHAT domain-containing protein n=1 Tax=Nocardia salmonicida TaxID=53431 RepID=UPI00362684DD
MTPDYADATAARAGCQQVLRFRSTADLGALDAAVDLFETAVALTTDRTRRSRRLGQLAEAKRYRYEAGGAPADLADAIEFARESIDTADVSRPGSSDLVRNLAYVYRVGFERTGIVDHLLAARNSVERALGLAAAGTRARLDLECDLVEVMCVQAEVMNDPLPLEEAVEMAKGISRKATGGELLDLRGRLAIAAVHRIRYSRYRDHEDVVQEIGGFRSAVELTPPGSPDRPHVLTSLGAALRHGVELDESEQILKEAVSLARDALGDVEGSGSRIESAKARLAAALDALASTHAARACRSHTPLTEVNFAVDYGTEARRLVASGTDTWSKLSANLARSLVDRYRLAPTDEDLARAEQVRREVIDIDTRVLPDVLSGLADVLLHRAAIVCLDHARVAAVDPVSNALDAADLYGRARMNLEDYMRDLPVSQRLQIEQRRQELICREVGALVSAGRIADALVISESAKAGFLGAALRRLPVDRAREIPAELWKREQHILDEWDMREVREIRTEAAPTGSILGAGLAIRTSNGPTLDHPQMWRRAKNSAWRSSRLELDEIWHRIEAWGEYGRRHVAFRRGRAASWSEIHDAATDSDAETGVLAWSLVHRASPEPGNVDGDVEVAAFVFRGGDGVPSVVWTGFGRGVALDIEDRIRTELGAHNPCTPRHQTWDTRLQLPISAAAEHLSGIHRLVVSSIGALAPLPWPALLTRGSFVGFGSGLAVSMVPALSIAVERISRVPAKRIECRALGDPDGSLPHARAEAVEVARIWRVRARTGPAADLAAAARAFACAELVHMACHAFYVPDNPLESGVCLADGNLRAHELLDENMAVELVVLSACRTGRDSYLPGDNALGLASALLRAGVRSLVVSLWPVADESTAALMRRLHLHLSNGECVDVALAQAATEIARVKRWAHPYYWSGFVVIGDTTPLVSATPRRRRPFRMNSIVSWSTVHCHFGR